MEHNGLTIAGIEEGSIAEQLDISLGDKLVYINKEPVRDILDYRFLCATEELVATIITQQGEEWELEIEKDFHEDLGLDFGESSFGPTRRCHNRCLFCFVDQMAPSMRETLYIKDDDYRLSFWQGNFVSLTNVGERELQRIITQRMGPLYISVHTTNPDLRSRMLNNRHAGKIMSQLERLAEVNIEMHTQVVLCPEINDGEELKRTIKDLAGLWPQVCSLAVVPVGLTRYREGLHPLRPFNRTGAARVIDLIETYQQEFRDKWEYPFVYASDEFYLIAGRPIPPTKSYADFPQTENGVGLVRLFLDEWETVEKELPENIKPSRAITLVTGNSGSIVLGPLVERLNRIGGLMVKLETVTNLFFGETVTVTGLITGGDIRRTLEGKYLGEKLVLPAVMLRDGENVFLDDMTVDQLSDILGIPIEAVEGPQELIQAIVD